MLIVIRPSKNNSVGGYLQNRIIVNPIYFEPTIQQILNILRAYAIPNRHEDLRHLIRET